MSDEHINRFPKDGQEQGDHHPQNIYSEHKYPPFFRLFNRGDRLYSRDEFPKDLDPVHYVPKHWDTFVEEYTKRQEIEEALSAKEDIQGYVVPDYEKEEDEEGHEPKYTYSENYDAQAQLSSKILSFLRLKKYLAQNAQLPSWFSTDKWASMLERSLVLQYFENSLHPISSIDSQRNELRRVLMKYYPLARIFNGFPEHTGLKLPTDDEMMTFIDSNNKLESGQIKKLIPSSENTATGVAPFSEMYAPIKSENEAREIYENLVAEPSAYPMISLGISKKVFEVASGGDFRSGGWFDGQYIPRQLREQWIKNGLRVNIAADSFAKRLELLKNMRLRHVVGKSVAKELERASFENMARQIQWTKGKYGAYLSGISYGGLLLWAISFRWLHMNNREYRRQQIKFAYRCVDEDSPGTINQYKINKKHEEWAKTYFADEDNDDDADEEEEEDEE